MEATQSAVAGLAAVGAAASFAACLLRRPTPPPAAGFAECIATDAPGGAEAWINNLTAAAASVMRC
jgi:hypothetical protein